MVDRICKWAHERMNNADFVLLDTETSSLDGEVIDLAIVDAAGAVMFDSLIKPVGRISEAARAVHHISDAMLADAPNFAQVWPEVKVILSNKIVITYNSDFDFSMIALSLLANGIKDESYQTFAASEEMWHCLMNRYQQHINKSRWQKLELALQQQGLPISNTHRALDDAQAAYSLLKHLARKYEGSAYQARQIEREKKEAETQAAAQLAQAQTDMERAGKLVNYIREREQGY